MRGREPGAAVPGGGRGQGWLAGCWGCGPGGAGGAGGCGQRAIDRGGGDRSLELEDSLGGQRRSVDAQQRVRGRWGVQIDRRRRELDECWTEGQRAYREDSGESDRQQ